MRGGVGGGRWYLFLKSLSSLPGFSCHGKEKMQSLLQGVAGFGPLHTPAPPRIHSLYRAEAGVTFQQTPVSSALGGPCLLALRTIWKWRKLMELSPPNWSPTPGQTQGSAVAHSGRTWLWEPGLKSRVCGISLQILNG